MRSKLKSEDGAALFVALFFFLFAAVFSAFIIQKSFVNFNAVNSMKNTNSNKTSSDSDDNLDISTLISIAETIRDYIEDEQDGYISEGKKNDINYSKLFSKKAAKDSEDNEDSKKEFKNFKAIFEGILNEELPEEGSLEIADRKKRKTDKFFYQISFDDGILTAVFKNNKDDDVFVRLTMEDKISGLDFDDTDPKTLDEIVDKYVNDYLVKYGYGSLFLVWNQTWLANEIINAYYDKWSLGLQTKIWWKIVKNYTFKRFIRGESDDDEKHNIQDYYLFENPRIKIIRE